MNRIIYLVFVIIFMPIFSFCQPTLTWVNHYGGNNDDFTSDIILLSNGSYIMSGYSVSDQFSTNSTYDFWVKNIDLNGSTKWEKNFVQAGNQLSLVCSENSDNSILVGGISHNNLNKTNAKVIKIDQNGNLIWNKEFGGREDESISKIISLPDGTSIVLGTTASPDWIAESNYGMGDIFMLKINANGDVLWKKRFGGDKLDIITDAFLDNNSIFICGNTFSKNGFFGYRSGISNAFIAKFNLSGDVLWKNQIQSTFADFFQSLTVLDNEIYAVGTKGAVTPDHSSINSGYKESNWLVKFNSNGDQIINNFFENNGNTSFSKIIKNNNKLLVLDNHIYGTNLLVGIQSFHEANIHEISKNGTINWTIPLKGNKSIRLNNIAITNDGFLVAGSTNSSDIGGNSLGNTDQIVIRYGGQINTTPNLGENRKICSGASIFLDATISGCDNCSYLWNDGVTTSSRTVFPTANTTYAVTVTQGEDSSSDQIFIEVSPTMNLSITSENGNCEKGGELTAQVSGGTPPFDYYWSNQETNSSISNLNAGTYSVTVEDNFNCTQTNSSTIFNEGFIGLDTTVINVSCKNGNDGSIQINVAASDYRIAWSSGSTGNILDQLSVGTYMATVTIGNDCEEVFSFNISAPNFDFQVDENISPTCGGLANGSIELDIVTQANDYTLKWSNGATSTKNTNLTNGIYTVTLTSSSGCEASYSYIVSNASISYLSQVKEPTCHDDKNGSIEILSVNNNNNFELDWEDGSHSNKLEDLSEGSYKLTITSDNACTKTIDFVLTNPPPIEIQTFIQSESCIGKQDGKILLDVQNGISPFKINWDNQDEFPSLFNLSAGEYYLTITDSNLCSVDTLIEIPLDPEPTFEENINDINCYGDKTGLIALAGLTGNGPFSYHWNDGQNTNVASDLEAGTHIVTITDSKTCNFIKIYSIEGPQELKVQFDFSPPSSTTSQDGEIKAIVMGGTPDYTYQWSDQSSDSNLKNIGEGEYLFQVWDANFCSLDSLIQFTTTSNVTDLKENFNIFPNPTRSILNIKSGHLVNSEVILFSIEGKSIFSSLFDKEIQIDVSKFPKGIYTLKIINDTVSIYSKIILQ